MTSAGALAANDALAERGRPWPRDARTRGRLLAFSLVLVSALAPARDTRAAEESYPPPYTLFGRYPVSRRDPRSITRIARRMPISCLVRVRARQGTFIGHVAAVRDSGLLSLAPDPGRTWSGPVDLLAWNDVWTIEVRRRSPLRAAGLGAAVGGMLGGVGGLVIADARGGDGLVAGFVLGLAGVLVGGPLGLGVGIAIPVWEPLYRAP